ncbi:MAG TPA: hypothetical protein VG944_05925 [Fimbriimonas sp.]|nr:hypothetical protein [Fimbriimonas sp.]
MVACAIALIGLFSPQTPIESKAVLIAKTTKRRSADFDDFNWKVEVQQRSFAGKLDAFWKKRDSKAPSEAAETWLALLKESEGVSTYLLNGAPPPDAGSL